MNQRMVCLLLTFAVVGMTTAPVFGQGKKKGTKGKKGGAATITFQVYKDKGGKYRYRLKNADGKSLAIASTGIKSQKDIMAAISTIQKNAAKAKVVGDKKGVSTKGAMMVFETYKDKGGKYRFRMKGAKGKSLGRSSIGFQTKAQIDAVISAIQKGASKAKVTQAK